VTGNKTAEKFGKDILVAHMEFLRSWMLSITAAALAGMLVYVLAPKGGTKKAVRTVTAVFFLASFFLPFAKFASGDFIMPNFEPEEAYQTMPPALEQALENQVLRAQQEVISQIINEELARRNLPSANEIAFDTDILPDGRIAIGRVSIQCQDGPGLAFALKQKIKESSGIEIQVVLL
jgi:hypothetical protein